MPSRLHEIHTLVKLLFWLVSRLPLPAVYAAGGTLGRIVFWLSPQYRARLRENLRAAGYSGTQIIAEAARGAGRQAFETGWIWLRSARDLFTKVDAADFEQMQAAQSEGRPTIYLTPHLGCFEVCSKGYAMHAGVHRRPMTVLYRIPRKSVLRAIVESGRMADHLRLAPADLRGVRMLIKAMQDNEAVGILPDQVPSQGDGVYAPFFGRPAYTMTLPLRLATKFNATIILVYGERLVRGRGYRIHTRRLQQPLTGDAQRDAATVNQELEAMIRECPTQYLWGYNRYKAPAAHPGSAVDA